jgi:hypothetical protein
MPHTEATVRAVFASDSEATRLSRSWKPLVWVAGMEPYLPAFSYEKFMNPKTRPHVPCASGSKAEVAEQRWR